MEGEEERAYRARMAHIEAWFSARSGRPVTAEVVTRRASLETRVHEATGPLLRFERHPTRCDVFRLVFDGSSDPRASSATPWLVVGTDVVDVLEAPGELAVVKAHQRFEFHDRAVGVAGGRTKDGATAIVGAEGEMDARTVVSASAAERRSASRVVARTLPGNLEPGGSGFAGLLEVDLVDGRLVVTGRRATPRTALVAAISRTLLVLSVTLTVGLIQFVTQDVRGASQTLILMLFVAAVAAVALSAGATVGSWIWARGASPVQSVVFPSDSVRGRRFVVARGPVGPDGREARLVMHVPARDGVPRHEPGRSAQRA